MKPIDYFRTSFSNLTLDIDLVIFAWLRLFYRVQDPYFFSRVTFSSLFKANCTYWCYFGATIYTIISHIVVGSSFLRPIDWGQFASQGFRIPQETSSQDNVLKVFYTCEPVLENSALPVIVQFFGVPFPMLCDKLCWCRYLITEDITTSLDADFIVPYSELDLRVPKPEETHTELLTFFMIVLGISNH